MTKHFGTNHAVISSVEVYDKHIITCNFSYHTFNQKDNTTATRKRTKEQTKIYKVLHRKLMISQHKPHKNLSSCSTSATRRVTLIKNTM